MSDNVNPSQHGHEPPKQPTATSGEPEPAGGTPSPAHASTFRHLPVLVDRVVDIFSAVPPGWIVDCTVGGGGHAAALLERLPQVRVLGLDRDADAVEAARRRGAPFGDRFRVVRARFDELGTVLDREGVAPVVGVLFDLGVSSPQIDRAERGFSFRQDGPLDMRMDDRQELTAEVVVNTYTVNRLASMLRRNADERYAERMARAIVASRPLHSTTELADVVRESVPAPARRAKDPARRAFQAIRIEVNGELDVLVDALDEAIDRLVVGGRVAALAYHSGEDRIVKERFRRATTGGCTCPATLPCGCGAVPEGRLVHRGAVKATADEIALNSRAESVRLRALERIDALHEAGARAS